jgi:hypothetical protein
VTKPLESEDFVAIFDEMFDYLGDNYYENIIGISFEEGIRGLELEFP